MADWKRTPRHSLFFLGVGLCVVVVLTAGSSPLAGSTAGEHSWKNALGPSSSSQVGGCEGTASVSGGSHPYGVIEARTCIPTATHLGSAGNFTGGSVLATTWYPNRTLAWSVGLAPPTPVGEGAGFAADPAGDDAVLFGGEQGGTLLASTQLYNQSGDSWSTPELPQAPSPRSHFAFAGDASARVAVLFGGVVNATSLRVDNATWVYQFSAGTWTNVSGVVAPEPREDSAFAIDPAGAFGLLFGGWNQDFSPTSSITYSDLWRFNLTTDAWTQLMITGTVAPPPLHGASLAWDPVTGRFDLFGGCYPCSSDVWQFDPVSGEWSQLPAPTGPVPSPRADASWNWDPEASADVLFGGTDGVDWFNDTYEFLPVANEWVRETPSTAPSPRFASASAWLNVSGNQTLLLSGGNASEPIGSDLWRLAPTSNLSVLAINASSLLPLDDAKVSINDAAGRSTNAAGYLNLTEIVPAETSVNVTRLGYAANASTFWIPPGSNTSVEYALAPVAPVRLDVRVLSVTGRPLLNVSVGVTVQGLEAPGSPNATNFYGYANFTRVPSEIPVPEAVVVATAPENYSNQTLVAIPPGSVENTALELTPFPEIDLQVLGSLANGIVLPVHDAAVTEDGASFGTTDATGWLNRTSLAPGNVSLSVSADGFQPESRPVSLPRVGTDTVGVTLTGLPFGALQVWVLEAVSLLPVPAAMVRANAIPALTTVNTGTDGVTNATGWATLSLPQGAYRVSVSAYGYYPSSLAEARVWSSLNSTLTVYLQLLPGATVDVLVQAADTHAPLSSSLVLIGTTREGLTDANGWANFTDVHFGFTPVNVSHLGYFTNITQWNFTPGEMLPHFLVNLTPGIAIPVGPTGPSGPFGGGFPPPVGSWWPYLVAVGLTLVGAVAYLSYLRTPKRGGPRPAKKAPVASEQTAQTAPPPPAQ